MGGNDTFTPGDWVFDNGSWTFKNGTIDLVTMTITIQLDGFSHATIFVPDSDNDSMPDAYEITFSCLNPVVYDINSDPDNDNLSNINEFYIKTNLCFNDTDSDGIKDGTE